MYTVEEVIEMLKELPKEDEVRYVDILFQDRKGPYRVKGLDDTFEGDN